MSWGPKQSVVRVLGPKRTTDGTGTAGSGFLVKDGDEPLIATCAHVIKTNAASGPGRQVRVELEDGREVDAVVESEAWRPPEAEDIAFLRLEGPLPGTCRALALARLQDYGRTHRTWGYPAPKAATGHGAQVTELAPSIDAGFPALSARSEQVTYGFSGAPVWDDEADVAIGMVMSIAAAGADPGGRLQTSFYVRPAELLWDTCPELRPAGDNPYRGLEVFEEEHADLYFGRDRAIAELLHKLSEQHLVAVVGISGSGKSSLARAGLRRGLKEKPVLGLADKPRVRFRPSATPRAELAAALGVPAPEGTPDEVAGALEQALPNGAILVADQFERLFTQCRDENERRHFADTLLALASPELKVLLTLRADFYGRVLELPALGAAVSDGLVTLQAMTREELLAAVEQPASACTRALEPGLADLLVRDVEGRPGDLPLLQLTLSELWRRDAESGLLRTSTYEALGAAGADGEPLRVRGVIAQLAEAAWHELPAAERPTASRILLNLVTSASVRDPLGGVDGAARRVFEVEWDERTRAVAGKLVDARLLTTGRDEATRQSTVEVAHEALIWAWPRLRDLVMEHGELISWYDGDFAPWLQRWDADDRPSELLLRGRQLDAAQHWLAAVPEMLTGAPADFIEASLAQRAEEEERWRREAERERERERALQVSESLRLASEAREAAEREPETAFLVAWEALLRDRNELSEAVFRVTLDRMPAPVQALWPANSGRETPDFTADGRWVFALDQAGGALELWRVGDGERGRVPVPGTGEFLAAAVPGSDRIVSYRGESLRLHAPDTGTVAELEPFGAGSVDVIYSDLTASRDGRRCVVHLEDRAWLVELDEAGLRLLAAYALQAPRVVEWDGVRHQPGSTVFAARLDREGRTILTEGSDGVCLWDDDGEVRARLSGAESPASAAILDAGVVVTGGQDGEGRLWDTSGQPLATFRESGEEGIDLFVKALHPDGETFAAVVHYTDIVGVWSSTGDRLALLRHERALAAAFSHDGERLATGAPDGTVRVWDWRSQQQLSDLHGHDGAVKDVAFHPADRSQLLSADQGGGVRLWRLETGIIRPLAGHTGPVRSPIAITAAGVLSRSDDGTTRLWPPNGAPTVLEGDLLSRTGGRAVTGTETGAAKLWELEDGGARLVCESQPGGVAPREAVLSPDGSHFAVLAGGEGQLWNAAGDLVRSLRDDDDPGVESPRRQLEGVGFDADGARVAAASENGTVWIWKINGERTARFLADFSSPDRILSVAFDPLGELIACGVRKRTGLWSWDGELVRDLNVGGYKVFTVAFSPDGQRILTIADDPSGRPYVLELWERGGERVAQLDAPGAGLGEPLFDSGSRFFALRADGGIAVFGRDGTRLGVLAGARGVTSTAAAVSPDGGLVAAAFSDGVVRIWSHAGQRRTATLAVGEATAIAFDGGGRLLVGTPGGAIQPYLLDVEALFHPAAQRVDRVLTKDELARFGISEPLLTPERLQRERNV